MNYLLDTSVIIELLRKNERVRNFISAHTDDAIVTSCICEAEILTGVYHKGLKNLEEKKQETTQLFASFYEVIPFDSTQADMAGRIKADLLKTGQIIEDLDILIAAAAIVRNAILLTFNPKHFSRVKNLQVQTL